MPPKLLDQLRARMAELGLDAHAEAIMAQALPAIDIHLDSASSGQIGEHRFGGVPDLPASMPWPRAKNGQAFVFLLQINLAQAPTFDGNPLPARGMMWVFVGDDNESSDTEHSIIIWDGDEELQPASEPPIEESANENYIEMPPQRLRLELRADVPHWGTRDFDALTEAMSDGKQSAYHALSPCDGDERCIAQLLGHARGISGDPREDAFVARGKGREFLYDYDERREMDLSRAREWRNLLCQFSFFTGELTFSIWDAGFLLFLIHEDDLQVLDTSRVYASVHSS